MMVVEDDHDRRDIIEIMGSVAERIQDADGEEQCNTRAVDASKLILTCLEDDWLIKRVPGVSRVDF